MADGALAATVGRTVTAAADIVWAALTRPECLGVWLAPGFASDFRPGGRFSSPGGDAGEYGLIEEPRRYRMTWENAALGCRSVADVEVEGLGPEETRVAIRHSEIPAEEARVRLLEHWSWAVDSLDMFLKTGEGLPYEPWVDLQKELRRRAAEKSAAEAAEERAAAGVVLHEIPEVGTRTLPPPEAPAVPPKRARGRKKEAKAAAPAARGRGEDRGVRKKGGAGKSGSREKRGGGKAGRGSKGGGSAALRGARRKKGPKRGR